LEFTSLESLKSHSQGVGVQYIPFFTKTSTQKSGLHKSFGVSCFRYLISDLFFSGAGTVAGMGMGMGTGMGTNKQKIEKIWGPQGKTKRLSSSGWQIPEDITVFFMSW